jgi:hypothetical protein
MKNQGKLAHKIKIRTAIIIVLVCCMVPPFVSRGFSIAAIPSINSFILLHSIKHQFGAVVRYANSAALIIIVGAFFIGRIFARILSYYLAFMYVVAAFLQNISISSKYGIAICTSTWLISILVALSWLAEIKWKENDFSRPPRWKRLILLFPISILALWCPINPATNLPDPNMHYLFSSGSSLTFCMMTIAAISILLAYYPAINFLLLGATGLFGFLIGLGNLWLEFIYIPQYYWVGIFHVPLVVLSFIGITLSFKKAGVESSGSPED